MNSLEVFETFMGEPLGDESLRSLVNAPDEQIAYFGHQLSHAWDTWLSSRFQRDVVPESTPLFLQRNFHHGATSLISAAACKRLALYFDRISIPDPLEASVGARMMLWSTINELDVDAYKKELETGYSALITILPLLRTGALSLAPMGLGGLRPEVQEGSRRELAHIMFRASGSIDRDEAVELALATTLCERTIHWPVAGSTTLWAHLQSAARTIAGSKPNLGVIHQAVAEFEVPSASKVAMDDLIRLRANEQSFAEFRDAYGAAMREAAEAARRDGEEVAKVVLRDRLLPHRDRCLDAVKKTSSLEGMILPTGALLGAACVNYALGVLPSGTQDLQKLAVELAAPGAVWLAALLGQSWASLASGGDSVTAVYGALLET
jgi:hypothetical protein